MRLRFPSILTIVLLGRVLSGIIWALAVVVVAIAIAIARQDELTEEESFFMVLRGELGREIFLST